MASITIPHSYLVRDVVVPPYKLAMQTRQKPYLLASRTRKTVQLLRSRRKWQTRGPSSLRSAKGPLLRVERARRGSRHGAVEGGVPENPRKGPSLQREELSQPYNTGSLSRVLHVCQAVTGAG